MSIVCEEIFDEQSHPTIEEIKDYAVKIGIDPNDEPQLLPIAAEGLMKALPASWKPCYDEKSKSYYYYNRETGKTQWEHPLDNIYRNIVKKTRTDSQSISLGEPTDDATFARDDLPSLEEPALTSINFLSKKLEPLIPSSKLRDKSSSPRKLRRSPTFDINVSPRAETKFVKQKSEDHILINKKFSVNSQGDDAFEKHPRMFEVKPELKITGGGSMFLKSNTKKTEVEAGKAIGNSRTERTNFLNEDKPSDGVEDDSFDFKRGMGDNSEINDEDTKDNEEDQDDDKKNVHFNIEKKGTEFHLSDSASEDESDSPRKQVINPVLQVSLSPQNNLKSPFTLAMETDVLNKPPIPRKNLKVIKPNPSDFIRPTLLRTRSSESEDESGSGRVKKLTVEEIDLDSDNSQDSPNENLTKKAMILERKMEKKVEKLKDRMWRSKNKEIVEFQGVLEDSQREELKRIMTRENESQELKIAEELKALRAEAEKTHEAILKEEKEKLDQKLDELKKELASKSEREEQQMREHFERKKEELEKYYEEKLVEIENNLADTMERNRDEIMLSHNSCLEQLKENNSVICEQLKREFKIEEDQIRSDHQNRVEELRSMFKRELETEKTGDICDQDERNAKLMSEKRMLEDKYKCLKEKYIRLKTDVRTTIEKRNKKKEEGRSGATTTGSETEKSFSTHKERTPTSIQKNMEKPPTPKPSKTKTENRGPKETSPNDVDTSLSDRSEDKNKLEYDTSDNSVSHGRSRKKLFSRVRSNSTNRTRGPKNAERSCSPVENLRRQLQKLEDLEDQFPQNQQSDTYHLRYPFSDSHKFEGSSELEFFRHRIHLERDSIKRAKESLRNQKTIFQQRQNELKLKHGSMARHTYQQLCQEEKDLTDMEVSLHRTRSLLGEKVIRLRHLEQTLQRATVTNDPKYDDATLSDLSSHSASSGISSTEFMGGDMHFSRSFPREDSMQEPSEIIQSLESLNSEIREIWEVLRKQQQQSGNFAAVIPPFVYPDLGWPVLAGTAASLPAPPSIPTLQDRLNSYRQHLVLANAQSTVVTHAANQGATTSLVERTRNLRHWLKQAGIENNGETSNPQADL